MASSQAEGLGGHRAGQAALIASLLQFELREPKILGGRLTGHGPSTQLSMPATMHSTAARCVGKVQPKDCEFDSCALHQTLFADMCVVENYACVCF